MTQIRLDIEPPLGGVAAADDHSADVRGPGAGYAIPPMMRRKFVGQTATKVVRLSDILRVPSAVRSEFAENVNASYGVPGNAVDRVVIEFVPRAVYAGPD